MTETQRRNAWIWVTVAAIALASLARAQAEIQNARAYAHPMLEFLAGNQTAEPMIRVGVPRLQSGREHHATAWLWSNAHSGAGAAMLPIHFVGLISPLNLLSSSSDFCASRPPAEPILPCSFQRPPPLRFL